jgi:hypothetical protein
MLTQRQTLDARQYKTTGINLNQPYSCLIKVLQQPIATDISQQFRTLDPTTRELFFGSGIPGTSSYSPGFMQQAFRASEKTFYDEQGNPIVVPEQVAGLSPEQLAAINLSREKIGVQDPYLQQSQQAYGSGLESLFGGTFAGESESSIKRLRKC